MESSNRHPVDRLADVRSEIKRLEEEEVKLRAYLLEHPTDRTGEEHIAVVGSQSRKRVVTTEVFCDESFSTRKQAVEETIDRAWRS
jgi:hypothetical protein